MKIVYSDFITAAISFHVRVLGKMNITSTEEEMNKTLAEGRIEVTCTKESVET